jgi:hypothetical protein
LLRDRGLLLTVEDASTLKSVSSEGGCPLALLLVLDERLTVLDLDESKEDIQREERPERVW